MRDSEQTTRTLTRTGGHILADQLVVQGVEQIFCVPGESYLDLLDGLYNHQDVTQVITTRHEAAAANMADAYAKLTGKPGICLVTRGPGATNAANGIHTAFQDSTPVILLIGQVARTMADREAFQEMDYRKVFSEMAKWVAEIDDAARIPEYISRAFHVSQQGRPGPVVLALPEDMLRDTVTIPNAKPARPARAAPAPDAMAELHKKLDTASRPMMIVGGPTWSPGAVADSEAFAEANGLPVAVSFRAQDCFNNQNDHFVGTVGIAIDPHLQARIRDSDLIIAAGPRLGEMTTQGFTLFNIPVLSQTLIHVHPGADELGSVYAPDLGINANMGEFFRAARTMAPVDGARWGDWRQRARADYLNFIKPTEVPGTVNPGKIVAWLSETLPDDAIITNGAGNYATWVHRFFQYKRYRTQLGPTSGSMGYGVPAGIAAKIAEPERSVVAFAGDGCFQMLGQELATAVQYGANVIIIVVSNGILGTIRMHQERRYPARVIGTDLNNPDFVKLAGAYGAFGIRVERTEDFEAAFTSAQQSGKPALIELRLDPDVISPTETLAGMGGKP